MKIFYLFIIVLFIIGCLEPHPPYKLVYNIITKKASVLKFVYNRNRYTGYTEIVTDGKICCESLQKAKEYYKILMDEYERKRIIDDSWIEIDRAEVDTFSGSLHKEWDSYKKYK
uniref:Lipoprotein n=2 Tax=viral metagenome TaxID=1070528 RepID=A0A6M3LAS1_9ZZZZ